MTPTASEVPPQIRLEPAPAPYENLPRKGRRQLDRAGRGPAIVDSSGMHPLSQNTAGSVWRPWIAGKVVDIERIDIDAFEALVADALATIPEALRAEMENVAIIIDDESPAGSGSMAFTRHPLTSRDRFTGASPDRITLFLTTICRSARTSENMARRVRITLLHEVGHRFGIGEAPPRELGWS